MRRHNSDKLVRMYTYKFDGYLSGGGFVASIGGSTQGTHRRRVTISQRAVEIRLTNHAVGVTKKIAHS